MEANTTHLQGPCGLKEMHEVPSTAPLSSQTLSYL